MIGNPSVIYLDEPTSGMVTAINVVNQYLTFYFYVKGCWSSSSIVEYGDQSKEFW